MGKIQQGSTEDDVAKYRKKRKKKTPKKADHKHEYAPCVFILPQKIFQSEKSIGMYCKICGKIDKLWVNSFDNTEWITDEKEAGVWHMSQWSPRALREFDPKTRTLPCFSIEDLFQKYVRKEEFERA